MRKLAAFYFSGTGNTKFITKQLCKKLSCKYQIEINDITSGGDFTDIISNSDTVLLAYPIYGSAPPIPMRNFARKYADAWRGKEFIIIITQYMFSGDGAASLGRLIEKAGGKVVFAEHFNMPNNLADFKFFAIRNGSEVKRILSKADNKLDIFANKILVNIRPHKRGFSFYSRAIGYYCQRKWWRKNENTKKNALKIDINRCINCCLCVKRCPVGNLIKLDGKVASKGECVLCYRCVNACPRQAITILGNSAPVKQYRGI